MTKRNFVFMGTSYTSEWLGWGNFERIHSQGQIENPGRGAPSPAAGTKTVLEGLNFCILIFYL